jgi:hypothetical protein
MKHCIDRAVWGQIRCQKTHFHRFLPQHRVQLTFVIYTIENKIYTLWLYRNLYKRKEVPDYILL